MQTVKAPEFKAKCLQLMDEVNRTGEEIVITKNGVPVSVLQPYRTVPKTLFGLHKEKIESRDDLIAPWTFAGMPTDAAPQRPCSCLACRGERAPGQKHSQGHRLGPGSRAAWRRGHQLLGGGHARRKKRLLMHTELESWRLDLLKNGLLELPMQGAIALRAGSPAPVSRRPGGPVAGRHRP